MWQLKIIEGICHHVLVMLFDPDTFKTWGLAISSELKCTSKGSFKTKNLKFYKEDLSHQEGPGRNVAAINLQIQVALTK